MVRTSFLILMTIVLAALLLAQTSIAGELVTLADLKPVISR